MSDSQKPPREVTIYCDKGNGRHFVRKIGFKDAVWMDSMKTGTESTFVCKVAYDKLLARIERLRDRLKQIEIVGTTQEDPDSEERMNVQACMAYEALEQDEAAK